MKNGKNRSVSLTLSPDEALVFFEWLMRVDEEAKERNGNLDDPELIVRWYLEGQLEHLVPVFRPDYEQLVLRARKRILKLALAPRIDEWDTLRQSRVNKSENARLTAVGDGQETIHLRLSLDEALVFSAWLKREEEEAMATGKDLNDPELIVRWGLDAQLEGVLVEPFRSDHPDRLRRAARRVLKLAIPDT